MTQYYPITVMPGGETIDSESGQILLACLRDRLAIRADCGGKGVCGKCLVIVEREETPTPITDVERLQISPSLIDAGYRMACQVAVAGAMQIRLPQTAVDNGHVGAKTVFAGPYTVDPAVRRIFADRKNGRQGSQANERWSIIEGDLSDCPEHFPAEALLHRLPANARQATVICRKAPVESTVLPGYRPESLGLAVDIGTTTVAAYLCDLNKGTILSSAPVVNPQRRHGEDVINRIQAAGTPEGLEKLHGLISDAVRYLADRCLADAGKSPADVDDAVVVGNTAMQHIFAGVDPSSLGLTPFEPKVRESLSLPAERYGLNFSAGARIFIMPVIAGFAGGDTVACALADGTRHREETTLIVDVGTNGELVLGSKTGLWSASCATGPAFEGAQIACGMRATEGAISACTYDAASRGFQFETIGAGSNALPLGMCGSGVIDAVVAIRNAGMLLPSGQMVRAGTTDGLQRVDIVAAEANPAGVAVYLSQHDIRQVQLAKAALATGIICLMEKAGIKQVDRTILTGAFGNAFNWRNAAAIGMLPDEAILGRVMTRTNLAGEGAVKTLLDRHQRGEADAVCQQTQYLHLADEPGFIRRFVAQTLFP